MKRREFLIRSATGLGAAWLTSKELLAALANQTALGKFSASDTVTLGNTGIKTSRLAMGTGTVGSGHHSNRFRRELGVDYLDVCLMHCVTEADWTERFKGVMDVLSEAKQKGIIRAHGCSCHSIEALRAAAKSPWVEIDLARINPIGSHMDADPETVVSVLREMKAAGKAIVGMKILGQGDLRSRQSEALRYALSLGVLDAFTIGAESKLEQEDVIRRIAGA